MGHVVDAGAPAAPLRLVMLHELDSPNAPQDLARLVLHFLRVEQVAGSVVGDADRSESRGRRLEPLAHEGGGDIQYSRSEGGGRGGALENLAVLGKRRTAAGGIH